MILRFGPFCLDTDQHQLARDGTPVKVEPQVFDLILLLAQNSGRVVSRDAMIDRIWGGRIVSEAAISSRISAARKALGDTGTRQDVIETVTKVGLRFRLPVETDGGAAPSPVPDAAPGPVRYTSSRDGTSLAWTTHGDGPALIRGAHWLSHLEQDWHSPIWGPLLKRLGSFCAVTRYDARGTGMSQRGAVDFSLDRLTEDLEAVADAAGLARFAIFAPSQAAPVALTYASRYPERVSALILLGGFALGRHWRERETGREGQEHAQLTLIREGWGQAGTPFLNAFSTLFMPTATPEQVANMGQIQRASADVETAIRLREAIDRIDVRDVLGSITTPTAVIHASGDAVHPISEGQRLAAGIPNAEFHLVNGDSHVLLPQDPACEVVMGVIAKMVGANTV